MPGAGLNAIGGLIIFISFISSARYFPTGGVLTQKGTLLELWLIPVVFLGVAVYLDKFTEGGAKIPWWIAFLCARASGGVWLGLSLGAVLILNEWYSNPEDGSWEPLFTATALSAAGVMAAQRWFDKMLKNEGPS